MEPFDLQFSELDMELLDEFLKHIGVVSHQFLSFLLGHDLADVDVRGFEVWEQQNEHFDVVPRDFDKVNLAIYIMKVSVQDFSLGVNAVDLEILDGH